MHINWIAFTLNPYDGYGRWGAYFMRELTMLGVGVHPIIHGSLIEMPGWTQRLAGYDFSKISIQCMTGDQLLPTGGRVWGFTMTEGTGVSRRWVENINTRCERLLVPCQQNAQAFENCGVTVPIHIVPGGIDPHEFPVMPVAPDRPVTFLVLGDRGVRKGLETAWSAFHKAFGGDPKRFPTGEKDVRMLIKSRPQFANNFQTLCLHDRRISVWRQEVERMSDVYSQIDCFVFPSRGEGYGLPPREAAAMGIPVIATRWGGLEDGLDHWGIPIESFKMTPADLYYAKGSEWAFPSIDETAEKMRWVFDHYHEAKANALKAADWLRSNQTWTHAAKKLIELLEKYG